MIENVEFWEVLLMLWSSIVAEVSTPLSVIFENFFNLN
jgi:hypothetical protein